jgi:hypothetical protein
LADPKFTRGSGLIAASAGAQIPFIGRRPDQGRGML